MRFISNLWNFHLSQSQKVCNKNYSTFFHAWIFYLQIYFRYEDGCWSVQLELYLHDIQIDLENLLWDNKKLQEHLQTAIKERKMMELILAELEEEHDKAIAKIEQLEGEVQIFHCWVFQQFYLLSGSVGNVNIFCICPTSSQAYNNNFLSWSEINLLWPCMWCFHVCHDTT